MKNHVATVVTSVTSALIVAALTYYFFGSRPEIPALDVQRSIVGIPMNSGNKMLIPASPDNYTAVYVVQKYEIRNNGDRIYKDVLVRTSDFRMVLAEYDGRVEILSGDKIFNLNPGDVIIISGVSDGYNGSFGIDPASKILVAVGDRPIPIRTNQSVDEGNPMYPVINFAVDNPFLSFMMAMVVGIILFFVFFLIAANIVVAIFPALTLKIFSNRDYYKELAFLNHIKKAEPERYAIMAKKAEKFEREVLPQIEAAS
ncbi:hypothetical protein [Mesorhizobium dulcispinae]|uniref:hypothetical protein n=1 Tax=Mesorhizobium dulcispinae TaxID=3072316 RepID=UPI002A248B34|nr:hypothetical protein [Mesorhizobium sp. VK23D]MDX8517194.1 hypothetical protein [Mesorhizobium sp. VK23D]